MAIDKKFRPYRSQKILLACGCVIRSEPYEIEPTDDFDCPDHGATEVELVFRNNWRSE